MITFSGAAHTTGTALVFDLDGVLVESGRWWTIAERMAVEQLGGEIPGEEPVLSGLAPMVAATALAAATGLVGRESELKEAIDRAAADIFRHNVTPIPGALAIVDAVAAHVPVAIATNGTRVIAEASIAAADLARRVPVIVAADEVAAGKPDPAVYLRACELLGADPASTIAVDDTRTGVAAAVAAGMRVIRFGPGPFVADDGTIGGIDDWSRISVSPAG